jgi:hypothetical protein
MKIEIKARHRSNSSAQNHFIVQAADKRQALRFCKSYFTHLCQFHAQEVDATADADVDFPTVSHHLSAKQWLKIREERGDEAIPSMEIA